MKLKDLLKGFPEVSAIGYQDDPSAGIGSSGSGHGRGKFIRFLIQSSTSIENFYSILFLRFFRGRLSF